MSDLRAEYQAIDLRQSNSQFSNDGDKIGEKTMVKREAVIPVHQPRCGRPESKSLSK
jgi:hypothetical protein